VVPAGCKYRRSGEPARYPAALAGGAAASHDSKVTRLVRSQGLLTTTHGLLLAAATFLGLSAAGTLELTFTLQPSYALLALAAVCGLPWALQGWLSLPRTVQLAAAALVAVYLIAMLAGSPARLPSQGRGGALRPLVYLVDLGLGLTIIALLCGVWSTSFGRRLLLAFCAGATVTAALAVYQWFALRFSLPLSDLNTAPNSDGFTTGHRFQGTGLLGWERTRGTFKEPLVLGIFCAMTLPLAVLAIRGARRRWRVSAAACLLFTGCAFALTVSSLSVGIFVATGLVVALIVALREGHVSASTGLAAFMALGLVVGPVMLSNPSSLSSLTGRTAEDLRLTADNRKDAWRNAVHRWEERPVLGYGPGQSSVRLAYRPDPQAVGRTQAPVVLGSAQGVWAASLVDAGILGLCAWAALFAAVLWRGVRSTWRERGLGRALILWSAATGAATAQFSGDRVDIRVWLALGVLAATSNLGAGQPSRAHEQADEAAGRSPRNGVGADLARG